MRCKCCDSEYTEYIWGDYYCSECCQSIIEARDFTMSDLERIMGVTDKDEAGEITETQEGEE